MKRQRWYNRSTGLVFHAVVKEWDNLEALAQVAGDNPVDLAMRIRASFLQSFRGIPSPFLRFICVRALLDVHFRQVADHVLRMLARQREHLARRGGPQS